MKNYEISLADLIPTIDPDAVVFTAGQLLSMEMIKPGERVKAALANNMLSRSEMRAFANDVASRAMALVGPALPEEAHECIDALVAWENGELSTSKLDDARRQLSSVAEPESAEMVVWHASDPNETAAALNSSVSCARFCAIHICNQEGNNDWYKQICQSEYVAQIAILRSLAGDFDNGCSGGSYTLVRFDGDIANVRFCSLERATAMMTRDFIMTYEKGCNTQLSPESAFVDKSPVRIKDTRVNWTITTSSDEECDCIWSLCKSE